MRTTEMTSSFEVQQLQQHFKFCQQFCVQPQENHLTFLYLSCVYIYIYIYVYIYIYFFFFNAFYFWLRWVFAAARGLFSSCCEQGLLFFKVRGLLLAVASLVAEHELQGHGRVVVARGLQSAGSVVVAHGLRCSAACGIFPDQGSNPCPLHWQADS